MLLPRALSFGIWAISLALIKNMRSDLRMKSIRGIIHTMPVTSIALVLAQLSIGGIPLLAAFPIRYLLWQQLSSYSIVISLLSLAGFIGLFIVSIRSLVEIIAPASEQTHIIYEPLPVSIILCTAVFMMFLVGFFPNLFMPVYEQGLNAFKNLIPFQ